MKDKILKQLLDQFNDSRNRSQLAIKILEVLDIPLESIADFDLIEKEIKTKLTEEEKFKLKILFKSNTFGSHTIKRMRY